MFATGIDRNHFRPNVDPIRQGHASEQVAMLRIKNEELRSEWCE